MSFVRIQTGVDDKLKVVDFLKELDSEADVNVEDSDGIWVALSAESEPEEYQLDDLARLGIDFCGDVEYYDYGYATFASFKGEFMFVISDSDYTPTVCVEARGVAQVDVDDARKFWRLFTGLRDKWKEASRAEG